MFTQEISDTGVVSGGLEIFLALEGAFIVAIGLLVVLALFKWRRSARPETGVGALSLVLAGALLIASGLAFHTLHVSVDGSALEVGFHSLSKEQIPLENITSCQATSYDWHDYGYGVHLERPKGKMYNVSGDEGIAVDLRLNNEPYKRLLFSSADPKAVCDALKEQNPDIKEA